MSKMCSICSAPPDVVKSINGMLKQKISMKKISIASGFHKSIVGRHSLRCVSRETATTFGNQRKLMAHMRPIVVWPAGHGGFDSHDHDRTRYFVNGTREISEAEAASLPDDEYYLLVVRYASPPPQYPDALLTPQELAAKEQIRLAAETAAPEETAV